jgi:hypothetical protein
MKMKLFDLLFIQKDTRAAEDYYFEFFIHLGKETRRNWERKNQTFLKLLKNPDILKDKNVFAKNKEDFMLELNRALYKYLYEYNSKNHQNLLDDQLSNISHADSSVIKERSSSDFNESQFGLNNNFNESSSILISEAGRPLINNIANSFNNLQNRKQNNFDLNFPQINVNQNNNNMSCTNNNQNHDDIKDISQLSTKEEFSDFEEEIENHQACIDQAIQNILSNNIIINNNIIENNLTVPELPSRPTQPESTNLYLPLPHVNLINQNFIDFIESQNNSNSQKLIQNNLTILKIHPNNSAPLNIITNDKNCNHKIYSKEFIPKTFKNVENLQKKLPMLKSFKPKYTKRENVDKKIIRRFKMFLKEKNKDKMLVFNGNNYDKHFWIMFLNGNLFPPMKYTDNTTGECVDFKSFNTKYLLWIFSKKGAKELYEKFLQEEASAAIANITSEYGVQDSNDLKQLESYVYNFSNIFDLNSVSTTKSRSASGNDINLLYPNYTLGNQAPTPDIPEKHYSENHIHEVTKPSFSKSK